MIDALFVQGHAVDFILGVVVLEFAILLWRRSRSRSGYGSGRSTADILLALAPGVCLLMALRAAMTGASWIWVAVWLAVSFPVHLGDMLRRRL